MTGDYGDTQLLCGSVNDSVVLISSEWTLITTLTVPCVRRDGHGFGVFRRYSDLQKSPQTSVNFLSRARKESSRVDLCWATLSFTDYFQAGNDQFCGCPVILSCLVFFFFRSHNSLCRAGKNHFLQKMAGIKCRNSGKKMQRLRAIIINSFQPTIALHLR